MGEKRFVVSRVQKFWEDEYGNQIPIPKVSLEFQFLSFVLFIVILLFYACLFF